MRSKLGAPELLLLLTVVVMIVGASRLLFSPPAHATHDVRRPLIVWFVLLAGGLSIWLVSAFHPW